MLLQSAVSESSRSVVKILVFIEGTEPATEG